MSGRSTSTRAACSPRRRRRPCSIDCSTIDVETARTVAAAASARGFAMVDAPVSGGVAGAEAATLTFMVGGPEAAFARAQPVLAQMGKAVIHAGGAGNGQAAKICNNMMLGIQMISVCEAMALARRLGPAARAAVRDQPRVVGPVLVADQLLPGAGPGAGLAGQPRLPARLHHGDDAQGPQAGAGGGAARRAPARPWARKPTSSTACSRRAGMKGWIFPP